MKILGIESSCDETGIAIVENGTTLVAQELASSMDIHAVYGGVIPEIAARSHIEAITPLIDSIFTNNNLTWDDIDGIAVTHGAGLSGSLLIGVLTARTLAIIKNKPLYAINHVEGHVYANFLVEPKPEFPLLSLIVSGGHSQLVYFRDHFDYTLLGQTRDDAIGEAFDKVAKITGLPYPGGPNIAKAAEHGNPHAYDLPKAKVEGDYNFSFSGLKTAVLRTAQTAVGGDFRTPSTELPSLLSEQQKYDIAASFQRVAVETVVEKTLKAYNEYKPKTVVIAGGVAANQELRTQLAKALPIPITYAPMNLCTDNGAMIATLGCYKAMQTAETADPYSLAINPNLKM
ncbi:MAG: tRNA (adenosine(37)-N6)-threonylcarbamoyltransferase complex transferase subunit TsaD [Candidatus Saccharimonadales bacterium]